METKLSYSQEGADKYFILINGEKQKCMCGCAVFGKSGDDHICNACEEALILTEFKCIDCQDKIELEDTEFYDSDETGPYCGRCFGSLPNELKEK